MDKVYPKILIIGETFHMNSGGGITLCNLFRDWPPDKLANAVDFKKTGLNKVFANIDIYELCNEKFVFNTFKIKLFRFLRKQSILSSNNENRTLKSALICQIKKTLNALLDYSGLRHNIFHYKISNEFVMWVNDFKPDYIYSQLSSRDLIRLVSDLNNITKIPVAIHIMDDWPITISSKGIFKKYWKKKINREFLELLNRASIFLSISKYMSEEYLTRYGKYFIPFHNPLDLVIWDSEDRTECPKTNGSFKFLYAGRIGKGIMNSLLDFIEALESLNDQTNLVYLYIQSSNIDAQFQKKISNYSCVRINPPVEYQDIPKIIKNADALVLCNDFDSEGQSFLKYSMPTKASEYMISKVPILLFCDPSNAVYRHAKDNEWAYLVGDNDVFLLKLAILDFINNKALRQKISENAFQYAKENFDSRIVRERFLSVFNKKEYV